MKKGKITTIESACIKGMIAADISTPEMAAQLERGTSIIEKEVARIKADSVKEQLFIKKTASGSKGVSIMTETASVRGDVAKNSSSSTAAKNTNRSQWIHKIKSDG